MKVTMMPVISASELERELEIEFGTIIEVAPTLFDTDFQNDCYKLLFIDENSYLEAHDEGGYKRELIIGYLREAMPNYDKVLIDVSW